MIKPSPEVAQAHSTAKRQSKKHLPVASPAQNPTHCKQLKNRSHLRGSWKIEPRETIKVAPSEPIKTCQNIKLFL
jgi:hypothetical protein